RLRRRKPIAYQKAQYSLSCSKRIRIQAGRGVHYFPGARISLPPRCPMSSSEPTAVRSPSENCARIKKLGYVEGKHVNLYGEHMELVSDPFEEGDCVAVRAVSEGNPTERTIDLPVSILAGWEDLFEELAGPTASELPAKAPLPGSAGQTE
ncbi:MAG: hypothetical protein ABSD70_19635, partial [Terracidiphilus sp.]